MFKLHGKLALITGASGGIGSAIAEALYQAGADLILAGTRTERLQEIASLLQSKHNNGQNISCLSCDLGANNAPKELIDQASAIGTIDILVNNAGITRDQLLLRMSDSDWEQVLALNLDVPAKLSRYALKGMLKARWGRVINITSVVGTTGNPGQSNYASAKAGLTAFTKSLAGEVAGRNITANCIAPGFIETDMTAKLSDNQRNQLLQNIPIARMGQGSDIAAGVVYLASDEAAYITGTTLHINGGLAMA